VDDKSPRDVDANLLLTLQALLEERHLTRAAARLMLTQPAVSSSLVRLRRQFGDELLVRVGRTYELTPFAEQLRPTVAAAVAAAERVFGGVPVFDPQTTTRVFSMSLTEYAMTVLAGPLVRRLAQLAPLTRIEFTPIPTDTAELNQHLLRRDLIIGPTGFDLPGRSQPVFTDEFVCVVAAGHPRLVDGALTIIDLQQMLHVVARFGPGNSTDSPDEVALGHACIQRNVSVTVPNLLALPLAIAGSAMVGFVPLRLVRRVQRDLGLVIARTPLAPIMLVESAHWHPSRANDPALSWLRNLLHDVSVTLEDEKA
jgi:DNA-binding transcriptional LysR family regulator